jgi:hypothetical protein
MPIRSEARLGKTQNGSFQKIAILETPASEDYPRLIISFRDPDNHFRQGVVEFCGDKTGRLPALQIDQDLRYHRRPIDDLREVIADLELVEIADFGVDH